MEDKNQPNENVENKPQEQEVPVKEENTLHLLLRTGQKVRKPLKIKDFRCFCL